MNTQIYITENIYLYKDIFVPIIVIPGIDFLLCKMFGKKTQWFQLHSAINGIFRKKCGKIYAQLSLHIHQVTHFF